MEHSVPERKSKVSPKLDQRVHRSRERLREALLDLLQTTPLEYITIRNIAATADVGYTTYFRHFPNKEALFQDLVADQIDRLSALTLPVYDAVDTHAGCQTLCDYVDQHRSLWAILLTGGAAGMVREELIRKGREVTATRPHSRGWIPSGLGVILAASSTIEILKWWLQQPDPLPSGQIADILDRVAISPVETERRE